MHENICSPSYSPLHLGPVNSLAIGSLLTSGRGHLLHHPLPSSSPPHPGGHSESWWWSPSHQTSLHIVPWLMAISHPMGLLCSALRSMTIVCPVPPLPSSHKCGPTTGPSGNLSLHLLWSQRPHRLLCFLSSFFIQQA